MSAIFRRQPEPLLVDCDDDEDTLVMAELTGRVPSSMRPLPLKAMYTIGQLASAARMDRRAMKVLLAGHGVVFTRSGRWWFVSLAEIERKVPALWEGIKTFEALRQCARDS